MQSKKITAFVLAYGFSAAILSLSAQPYGERFNPYGSPYNDPYNTPRTSYYNRYLTRPNYLNDLYFPNLSHLPYNPYLLRSPAAGPLRSAYPLPPPYPEENINTSNDYENESSPADDKAESILKFWFGNLSNPVQFPANKISLWEGSAEGDQLIRDRFSEDYQHALLGEYNDWRNSPQGRLALIILLDQFPRHIFPNQTKMFASDSMARGLALEGIKLGMDKSLYPIERVFFYMPLQHSENPRMQAMSVDMYNQIVAQSPPSIRPIMQEFLRLAIKHQEVIDRFGRFPHRNKILSRQSTPEETVYLSHKAAFRY